MIRPARHTDDDGNDLGTPPTYEEFLQYPSLFEQVVATGWVGYGDRAAHFVADSTERINAVIELLENKNLNQIRIRDAKSFEEFAYSFLGGQRGVYCAAGIADVVNGWAVVEVKNNATRDMIFTAIGQALVYRESIDPAKAALVFAFTQHIEALKPIVTVAVQLGVSFVIVHPEGVFTASAYSGAMKGGAS